jgi:hypothetical protein
MKIKRLGNAYCAVRLGTPPGDLLPVSETTFTAYLHSALKIQDPMLVVNDSCNMSWMDGNRLSSKYSGPYTSEHLTLARGNEAIPEPAPRDPGGTQLKPVAVHSCRLGRVIGTN